MPDLPPVFGRGGTAKARGIPKHRGGNRKSRALHKKKERFYNSRAWRQTSRRVLAQEPLCRLCREEGKTVPARHVDHIDGNCFNNPPDDSNYRALCIPCHTKVTHHGEGQVIS